jgi:hypothetical protein
LYKFFGSVDIAELYNLSQLINEPTRTTDSSSTLIDHIFTNTPDKVVCSGVSHVSISDHTLIYAFRKLSISLPTRGHSTVNYIESLKTLTPSNFVMILVYKIGAILKNLKILMICGMLGKLPAYLIDKNRSSEIQSMVIDVNHLIDID